MNHHRLINKYVTGPFTGGDWMLPGAVFLGFFILGCLIFSFVPRKYTARATIEIVPRESTMPQSKFASFRFNHRRFLETQARVIDSDSFLRKFAGQSGLARQWETSNGKTWKILERNTDVKRISRNGNLIDIFFTSPNATEAVEIANGIAAAYLEHWKILHNDRYDEMIEKVSFDHKKLDSVTSAKSEAYQIMENSAKKNPDPEELQSAKRDWLNFESMSRIMEKQLEQIRLEKIIVATSARIHEQASLKTAARGPNLWSGLFLIALASFLGAAGVAGLFKRSRRRKDHSIVRIAKAVAAPTLTVLPESEEADPDHSAGFQKLRADILAEHPTPKGVVVAVVPTLVGEQATPVAGELAKELAKAGHTTLIVDCDMASPTVQYRFNASSRPGLSDFLDGEMQLVEAVVKSPYNNLWILPGGTIPESSAELLRSEAANAFFEQARNRIDVVVLNCPPLMSSIDSLILVERADMTFLSAQVGKAPHDLLVRSRRAIEEAGGTISGLVLRQAGAARSETLTEPALA